MEFGIFVEQNLPRPWAEDSELRIVHDALEQVALADRLGFDNVWAVEHHFLEEYSHLSAPESFLAAASQRTSRIRLGHGIMHLPPAINHPFRAAERIAYLDLLSGGRVEFGTGEATSLCELEGFGVPREAKRAMWQEALDAVTRMFVEEPFAGYEGDHLNLPPRNVVPKPSQKPHPPLWMACTSPAAIEVAARAGLGVLSFSFLEPDEAKQCADLYYGILQSDECVPMGFAVNANIAVVAPFLCLEDEQRAVEVGLEGFDFFLFGGHHFFSGGEHTPGLTDVWAAFKAHAATPTAERSVFLPNAPLIEAANAEPGMHRGAVGTPDQVRNLLRAYSETGVDQIMFLCQGGNIPHDAICESMELFAREVMPEFKVREHARVKEKSERLAPAIEAALARREPARPPPDYRFGG